MNTETQQTDRRVRWMSILLALLACGFYGAFILLAYLAGN
jgi:hypothetical protein